MGTLAINEVKKTMNPQDNQVNQNMNRQQNESMGFDKYVAIALIVGLIAGFIIGNSVGSSRTAKMSKTATTTDSVIYGNKDASTTANVNADITQGNLSTNSPAVGGNKPSDFKRREQSFNDPCVYACSKQPFFYLIF